MQHYILWSFRIPPRTWLLLPASEMQLGEGPLYPHICHGILCAFWTFFNVSIRNDFASPTITCHILTALPTVNAVHCIPSFVVSQPGKLCQPVMSERVHFGLFNLSLGAGLNLRLGCLLWFRIYNAIAEGPGPVGIFPGTVAEVSVSWLDFLMKKLSMFLPLFIFTRFVVFIFFSVSFRQLWRSACLGRSHFFNSHLEQWKRRQPIRGKETPPALSLIGDSKSVDHRDAALVQKKYVFTRAASGAPVRL